MTRVRVGRYSSTIQHDEAALALVASAGSFGEEGHLGAASRILRTG